MQERLMKMYLKGSVKIMLKSNKIEVLCFILIFLTRVKIFKEMNQFKKFCTKMQKFEKKGTKA